MVLRMGGGLEDLSPSFGTLPSPAAHISLQEAQVAAIQLINTNGASFSSMLGTQDTRSERLSPAITVPPKHLEGGPRGQD